VCANKLSSVQFISVALYPLRLLLVYDGLTVVGIITIVVIEGPVVFAKAMGLHTCV